MVVITIDYGEDAGAQPEPVIVKVVQERPGEPGCRYESVYDAGPDDHFSARIVHAVSP